MWKVTGVTKVTKVMVMILSELWSQGTDRMTVCVCVGGGGGDACTCVCICVTLQLLYNKE